MDRFPALSHLFTTNEAPRSIDLSLVKQELETLDKEVIALRQKPAPLERAREECLTVLSPLRRVPLDILGVIISSAVDRVMSSAGREELISLCLVCKAWRQAALASHRYGVP